MKVSQENTLLMLSQVCPCLESSTHLARRGFFFFFWLALANSILLANLDNLLNTH